MTKSRHSATRLRLSRLFRWLAVLCFIKLAMLGMLMLDMPTPGRPDGASRDMAQQDAREASGEPASLSVARAPANSASSEENPSGKNLQRDAAATLPSDDAPQGAAAAQLAAAAKPRRQARDGTEAALPAPPLPGGRAAVFSPPALPAPAPLGAPAAEAGTPAPDASAAPLLAASAVRRADHDDGLLDMLGLKNLPIPGLGSVQAAHAAALDMPVPQTPPSVSPFTPAEQQAPTSMPGAPDIPANIPRGQGADGAPLPPRGVGASSATPSLPQRGQAAMPAPAPRVTANIPPDDPNNKAQELARQQQDILMLRQQMDQRLKDLQDAERKMKDMIREAKDLEDKKIRSLIQMYANMKPRTAAKALENMDERVAIRILSGMAPKQSGEILTYTNPAKTAKFTELITRMRLPD
ncbi:hypothetical protein [Desulfovibrio sp. SGI.169]|uniref:MotE family protein n=1 Tax=Desulfovibrio sp. SGI.169 TaxID=3420561 RepID=UPI003D0779B5